MRRRGITPVEVLLLVVVLGAIVCGLVVWIQQAREAARRTQCGYNMGNIAKGLRQSADSRGSFPRAAVANKDLPPDRRLSWYVAAWSFVGDGKIQLLADEKKPWDAEENLAMRVRGQGVGDGWEEYPLGLVPAFLCPSASRELRDIKPGPTSYVGIAGIGEDAASLPAGDSRAGVFGHDRQTRPGDITKEQDEVALLAETALDNGPWTAGGRPTVRGVVPEDVPFFGVGRQFGGNHPGGGNVAFVGGAVRFITGAVDPDYFAGLAAIGE